MEILAKYGDGKFAIFWDIFYVFFFYYNWIYIENIADSMQKTSPLI